MSFQPRFHNGVYRDCKWCQGAGCLSCPVEAERAYQREFPNGPEPIVTVQRDDPEAASKLSAATGIPVELFAQLLTPKQEPK